MTIEKEYEEVFKKIETSIIYYYKEHPDLIDSEVYTAIEWLIKYYTAESQGRTSGYSTPKGTSGELAEKVKATCEVILGKPSAEKEKMLDIKKMLGFKQKVVSPSEMSDCLKRIKSSIKFWTKQNGRQGYLNYVKKFIR